MTPAVLPRLSISGLATAFDTTVFAILRKQSQRVAQTKPTGKKLVKTMLEDEWNNHRE
jgi:hypothetical protein